MPIYNFLIEETRLAQMSIKAPTMEAAEEFFNSRDPGQWVHDLDLEFGDPSYDDWGECIETVWSDDCFNLEVNDAT